MKNLLLVALLLFLMFIVAEAQIKTDLAILNLKGKVKTLKTEKAIFTNENGYLIESRRQAQELITFDDHGYYTQRVGLSNGTERRFSYEYNSDGKILEKAHLDSSEVQVFNYLKNSVEEITRLRNGHVLDKWVHTFDDKGNETKREYVLIDKNLGQRLLNPPEVVVNKYDSYGNLLETAFFNHDGSPTELIIKIHKYQNKYDDRNRVNERTAYKSDNTIVMKWSLKYNDDGLLEEAIRFAANLLPLSKVKYSNFDADGNWTKSDSFKISVKEGKSNEEPTESEYRLITYYH